MDRTLLLVFALATASMTRAHADTETGEAATISQLLHVMFDKPNHTLVVEPALIAGDHAVADWAQGEMGGRALLRKRQGKWTLVLCAGDGIKTADGLTKVGVPAAEAMQIADDMKRAENKLSPDRVAMFSRFEGLVMMEGDTGH
ncbi:copper uptake system-associated protein [Nitrobacter sp. JJSN]|uniref:copper uptake system-associated protein n=1 Tax=Nitrobacter sp. JJSN TaxID=3453033 RepID=UPI003F774C7B